MILCVSSKSRKETHKIIPVPLFWGCFLQENRIMYEQNISYIVYILL